MDLSLMLSMCNKVQLIDDCAPVQSMPYFDGLAEVWSSPHPNAHMLDDFHIFCDVATKTTYAFYVSVGGFFGNGKTLFAGGLSIDSGAIESADAEVETHIAGYKWLSDGTTFMLETDIEDVPNVAWCDLDDWIYGALYFWDMNPDGTFVEKEPMSDEDIAMMQEALFSLGFENSSPEVSHLEDCLSQ